MGGSRGRLITLEARQEALKLIAEAVSNGARKRQACEELDISIRTLERWEKSSTVINADRRTTVVKTCSHKLTAEETSKIIEVANSEEFVNSPPGQIVPILADRGEYIASESSFYRIFKALNLNAHRGKSKPRIHEKPKEYIAKGPNEVWSWDISYLPSNIKGKYFYLYLILDIFSRKIVGAEVYQEESAENAAAVASKAYISENVNGNDIILHSDNGSPMKGATMLAMLQDLGVTPSFSRPSVSNDNPYSESTFRTIKYNYKYPKKPFESLEAARNWVNSFVSWYNNEHKHSGIKFVSPSQRHQRVDMTVLNARNKIYQAARDRNPSRWSKSTRNWNYIAEVKLNPGKGKKANKV